MPKIDPAEVEKLVLSLGAIGAHSGTGVCRTAFSAEWMAAQAMVRRWADDAGLSTSFDAAGNLWARAEGAEPRPSYVTGSHIDSQLTGGRYDGALGVIAGFLALASLTKTFGQPRRTLELVSLCEEEGSRFPTAGFWGSRAMVGGVQPDDLETVSDAQGISIGAAMAELGFDPAAITFAQRNDIAGFIELHIEQGPVLEDADCPVAIVEGITHIRHTEVTLTGVANHAGAFPMDLRADAMAGFSQIATAVIGHAEAQGRPAVTTIGRCAITPNAGAIIPGRVVFTIDARNPDPKAAAEMYRLHDQWIDDIAGRRGLTATRRVLLDHPAAPSDPTLVAVLEKAASDAGMPTIRMASGAGHDAQQMAKICPVAMIFVRSKDGRSHTPEEYSSPEDMAAGIQVLTEALYRLAYLKEA